MKYYFCLLIAFVLYCPVAVAKETVNDITQLNAIVVDQVVAPTSIEDVSRLVGGHQGPISIGGGRYSQGGQTATENALFLDMRHMDRIVNLDVEKHQITVEAGITWRKIQEAIDPHDLSLKTMQSYSNFTVGGSLSVNAHGRYVGEGPIIKSVESIVIVLADGSVKEASRTKNTELFFGAIGGYGGIGVIVQATLNLAENTHVERVAKTMLVLAYKDYFFHNIRNSKNAVFHNADLYPPTYTQVNAVTWNTTDKPVTVPERLAPQDTLSPLQQSLLQWISDGPLGKRVREYVYDPSQYAGKRVEWRNYEARYDVIGLEPPSREKSTYVLQEYFIPVEHFDAFVPKLAGILNDHNVDVLNVSIRNALPDKESLLSWARSGVFSFVIYYEQGVTDDDKKAVHVWTSELIDAALAEGGTYYLPYQIIATKEQFLKAYPNARKYFALKKRVDPDYKFRNKLWDTGGPHPLDHGAHEISATFAV
jgi:FAD/FMN-containing dehydrogenase